MESELSADKPKEIPPVPIKTYQWEDVKKAREAGGYPWTHLLKPPLEGEITAEDIIRETTPRRSMSREFSRSRTRSPVEKEVQKILNLDSSPGSSRKYGEEGQDEGIQIPNFSKEISLESDEDVLNQAVNAYLNSHPESQSTSFLDTPTLDVPKNTSPKGILKRRMPEPVLNITETREKTKCCHPLVNKIKHLADKTLQKLERNDNEKSPEVKRKKNENIEIRQLKSSPGAVRRQKFSAIKLGDSDELSKSMNIETPPPIKRDHIYEDIDESKKKETDIFLLPGEAENAIRFDENSNNKETESYMEKKSNASHDPSLVTEDNASLKADEHIMEKLHNRENVIKEAVLIDDEIDNDEPNVEELFQNQLDETLPKNDSPNITITEVTDEDTEIVACEQNTSIPFESSPSPSPLGNEKIRAIAVEITENEWSKPNSDHEYELIEKPAMNIVYTNEHVNEKQTLTKNDDELSSTTSLERKYLHHNTSDDEEQYENRQNINTHNDDILSAEALQKNIEDRFFVNTPSTVSRTECEVSTSQVDSSALENLPLKRDSRAKNRDGTDNKIQQRIKESTGKLKEQAGKLKTKIQNIKTKQFSMPERPKINFPERPRFKMPERPKISLLDRRKFSLPERPKFKKINISEKLSFGDKKKFSLPERPKMPDFPKFRMPDRPKINFPSLGRKNKNKTDQASTSDLRNQESVEFEAKTYPRLFGKKNKSQLPKTSSSPTLNREDTPPPTFTFVRMKKRNIGSHTYSPESPEQPREYGVIDKDTTFEQEFDDNNQFHTVYDFDKMGDEIDDANFNNNLNTSSTPDVSPNNHEYTHVINEINNDEFFVRPRGISRENIQVREYLSDEIRQAFKIPKNSLALMGSNAEINDEITYINDQDEDPELMIDDNAQVRYSSEDLNEKDDGYYTFPPIRPSRAKRKKKESEPVQYIDSSVNASIQFSEVDLSEDHSVEPNKENFDSYNEHSNVNFIPKTDLEYIYNYENDDEINYQNKSIIDAQTLPMPPRRKKKTNKTEYKHSSLSDLKKITPSELWTGNEENIDDIIVYRTKHEYIRPQAEMNTSGQSPVAPRRTRSRSSHGTSLCDDDRTSHGAESLTLDTHLPSNYGIERVIRYESPGYATVDKGSNVPGKVPRRSLSKTPPRRRKSNSSERKYYTVQSPKNILPDRPPRKKSSTSLITLDKFTKRSMSGDFTQYVEIEDPRVEEIQKDLKSGEVLNKMKDRPLPPPPRPPRGSKHKKKDKKDYESQKSFDIQNSAEIRPHYSCDAVKSEEEIDEIEVSTQTDPLPDDIDYELGIDDNIDVSMSSSLKDIADESHIISKSFPKLSESPTVSRPTSRILSDPKLSELSKVNIGRTSPTVILVEKRVSSPTRINERDVMLTEASLTVQPIDIEESQVPDVPPLPRSRGLVNAIQEIQNVSSNSEHALKLRHDSTKDLQLNNLKTQRLQVQDLDVGRLNVSELQASKILVSDIEGMSLQVTELDSKSGQISVSGIEFSQSVIEEIVKKFSEITTSPEKNQQHLQETDHPKPIYQEEETQTDNQIDEVSGETKTCQAENQFQAVQSKPRSINDSTPPPQRPPPPDLTPLLYSYLQDINLTSSNLFPTRSARERPFSEFHESQHQTPPPPARRPKRKPPTIHSETSSDECRARPSPRKIPPPVRTHEPTISEAGAQFLRVCQNSISRTFRHIFNSFMTYISGTEDKKDMQMALVIFLVLIAGLIMFGLSDTRTIHHHHWEFLNPPDGKQ